MLHKIRRASFWQFGSVAFVAGVVTGLVAGASLFAVALLLVGTILSAVLAVLVTAIRAASMAGDDANQALYENLWVFWFVASAAVAAFAGYSFSVLVRGGL